MLSCRQIDDIVKMKRNTMNKKVISVVFGLVASSLMFVATPVAQAGDCSAADPCQTYAMVNDAGVVTNIIVCQPSVCGSGEFAGSKVVPQVAADETGKNRGGFFYTPDSGNQVTESNGVFTLHKGDPVVQTSTEVIGDVATTVTTTTSNGGSSSFTFDNTVGAEQVNLVPTQNTFNEDTSASVSIQQTVQNSETTTVSANFEERTTVQVVEETLKAAADAEKQVALIDARIAKISSMLRKWLRWLE
jgi:hypothetical protein